MTEEQLRKEQKCINRIIRRQAQKFGLSSESKGIEPIYDGIADEEAYLASSFKIAWILKEPYDYIDSDGNPGGGGWSLPEAFLDHDCDWVKTKPDGTRLPLWTNQVWQRITYVMYGFNHDRRWKTMEYVRDDHSMMNELKAIAWINLSKMPALTSSGNKKYEDAFKGCWKNIVLRQIESYDPDILIFGGTFDCFRNVTQRDFIPSKIGQNAFVRHYLMGKRHCLDTSHPGRKGGAYVDAIIKSLNAIATKSVGEDVKKPANLCNRNCGSYHVCAKCGYTDKGLPKPPQAGGFKPLREKCPKCGADEFYLHNIAWV